jgi:YD repeat-containing protein
VSDGTNSAAYTYLANSPLIGNVVFKQNSTVRLTRTNQYDNLNRLSSVVWKAGSTTVASFAYEYNAANQRTRCTLADGSYWLYAYDALGQVTSAKRYWYDGTPAAGQHNEYAFDEIGNRTTAKSGGDTNGWNLRTVGYTANNLNQYTAITTPGYEDILGVTWQRPGVAERHRQFRRQQRDRQPAVPALQPKPGF